MRMAAGMHSRARQTIARFGRDSVFESFGSCGGAVQPLACAMEIATADREPSPRQTRLDSLHCVAAYSAAATHKTMSEALSQVMKAGGDQDFLYAPVLTVRKTGGNFKDILATDQLANKTGGRHRQDGRRDSLQHRGVVQA